VVDLELVDVEDLIRKARPLGEACGTVPSQRATVSAREDKNRAERRGFQRADARIRTADPFITS
jgi:hypothetical protein